jgi:hypothetical protein
MTAPKERSLWHVQIAAKFIEEAIGVLNALQDRLGRQPSIRIERVAAGLPLGSPRIIGKFREA